MVKSVLALVWVSVVEAVPRVTLPLYDWTPSVVTAPPLMAIPLVEVTFRDASALLVSTAPENVTVPTPAFIVNGDAARLVSLT